MSSLASYCKKLDGSGETESLESVPTAPSLSLKLPQLLLDHNIIHEEVGYSGKDHYSNRH